MNGLKEEMLENLEKEIKALSMEKQNAWTKGEKSRVSKLDSEIGEKCYHRFRVEQSMKNGV